MDLPTGAVPPPAPAREHVGGKGGSPSATRDKKLREMLQMPNANLSGVRQLSWGGVPPSLRADVWRILLGYLPTNKERRKITLTRKRQEYISVVPKSFDEMETEESDAHERLIYRQIHVDIPRTNPSFELFSNQIVQDSLERVLFVWAIRHPASGYVQGINDLLTPFYVVFLCDQLGIENVDKLRNVVVEDLRQDILMEVEADCFWCITKLLDGIQDNYTFAQPGIQRMVFKLKELVARIDSDLAKHLDEENAQFIQFGFRWMNCLLMREIPLHLVLRMWDTYFAEEEGISNFHVYVCAAFILNWSSDLQAHDFQGIMMFLQNLPTINWKNEDIETLLAQGYMYKMLYHESPSHLRSNS
mmetsp:Transcript_11581/g.17546  ORF Transcript_11581/g.17546 Transcript_11581/m.17546 type:complete len:359 (-) Transcript_11581:233-1309(-)